MVTVFFMGIESFCYYVSKEEEEEAPKSRAFELGFLRHFSDCGAISVDRS